jgi:hypothetical protein
VCAVIRVQIMPDTVLGASHVPAFVRPWSCPAMDRRSYQANRQWCSLVTGHCIASWMSATERGSGWHCWMDGAVDEAPGVYMRRRRRRQARRHYSPYPILGRGTGLDCGHEFRRRTGLLCNHFGSRAPPMGCRIRAEASPCFTCELSVLRPSCLRGPV